MEELTTGGFVGKFGLDVRLLLAQVVNFLIVFVILAQFVFRPLLRIMRERTDRIAQGLKEAEDMVGKKRDFLAWQEQERQRAQRDQASLLARAEEGARARRELLLRQAEREATVMHDRATEDAARLQDDALARAREATGRLVVDVAERVLGKRLSAAEREEYLKDALEEVRRRARGSR